MPVGLNRNPAVVGRPMSPFPIKPPIRHSTLSGVSLRWSPGQGVRPRPGDPMHAMGLYLGATVRNGHSLHIDAVKVDKATRTLVITADARGAGAPDAGSAKGEKYVKGGFSLQAEKWNVIVQDSRGNVLAKKSMMLGGPPAP